ncbi:MAG: GNAT family N-acetyltransferase [Candidatus Kapaibacterium sp.]
MVTHLDPGDPRWLGLVNAHPDATIFHHPAWIGLIADCYRYRATVVMVDRGSAPGGGIPVIETRSMLRGRRLIALPFSDACAPLVADKESLAELIDGLHALRRQRGCPELEIRWKLPELPGVFPGAQALRHVTYLPDDPDELFRRFHRTRVQQPIRVAGKSGLRVERAGEWKDMADFYDLHLRTRQRHGIPVQPLRFFRLLWERLIGAGHGFLLLARDGDKAVAGALLLHFARGLVYKFNASDPLYWPMAPNHLLLWEALRQGCLAGYRSFDWGRTDTEHIGLRDFKRGWGAEEYPLRGSILADSPPDVRTSGASRTLMVHVIRRSPPWVCRALGELLYGQLG